MGGDRRAVKGAIAQVTEVGFRMAVKEALRLDALIRQHWSLKYQMGDSKQFCVIVDQLGKHVSCWFTDPRKAIDDAMERAGITLPPPPSPPPSR